MTKLRWLFAVIGAKLLCDRERFTAFCACKWKQDLFLHCNVPEQGPGAMNSDGHAEEHQHGHPAPRTTAKGLQTR
jgi:hypothetical protein